MRARTVDTGLLLDQAAKLVEESLRTMAGTPVAATWPMLMEVYSANGRPWRGHKSKPAFYTGQRADGSHVWSAAFYTDVEIMGPTRIRTWCPGFEKVALVKDVTPVVVPADSYAIIDQGIFFK